MNPPPILIVSGAEHEMTLQCEYRNRLYWGNGRHVVYEGEQSIIPPPPHPSPLSLNPVIQWNCKLVESDIGGEFNKWILIKNRRKLCVFVCVSSNQNMKQISVFDEYFMFKWLSSIRTNALWFMVSFIFRIDFHMSMKVSIFFGWTWNGV